MSTESVQVKWLESPPHYNFGTTFGLPWERGRYRADDTAFTCTTPKGDNVPIQSWATAYWPDDSIKWTAHAIPAGPTSNDGYMVHATTNKKRAQKPPSDENPPHPTIHTTSDAHSITVNTGAITATFPKSGPHLISRITNSRGHTVATHARLTLLTQSSIPDYSSPQPPKPIHHASFTSTITSVSTTPGPLRTTLKITGHHTPSSPSPEADEAEEAGETASNAATLPFTLHIHLHALSPALRISHTLTLANLPPGHPFIRGIALRFAAPLPVPAFDRHVAFTSLRSDSEGGSSGVGVLHEAAQGLTGLWRDPGREVRAAQVAGAAVPVGEAWGKSVEGGRGLGREQVRWVPVWDAWRLKGTQAGGFVVEKRTEGEGRGWVRCPGGGGRAGGVVFVGAAGVGGLGVGVRYFWERGPGGLEVRGVAGEAGEVIVWLWGPEGGAMDVRDWRGSLGERGYGEQVEAMGVTYEDWEEGMGGPEGVARTSEVVVWAEEGVPGTERLAEWTRVVRSPPVLVAGAERVRGTGALGGYWSPGRGARVEREVDGRLDFLFNFYKNQVEQRKWYGFWDHGDIMHTYDADRHTWRYDVGGYAWDNSELSPDLWLWLYFLRTGRADVYRMAEALTRHTGEVDVYHVGKYKGLGTRHGVQHWSDSCKQARISNALYRRFFYYLSGGDERTGELLEETLETEKTYLVLDPYRKVRKDQGSYKPDPAALTISLGTDWSALAASWLIEWERRGDGWQDARRKLLGTMRGIGSLANGFVTGQVSYNMLTGEISPPPEDPENRGVVKVSHLSAMFGLVEICADLLDSLQDDTPPGFREAWIEYCRYFNASAEEQTERFGVGFGRLQLRQGHSRLTAYAARELGDPELARRAWREFFFSDGYGKDAPWSTERIEDSRVLDPVDEAPWISTNTTALYGLAAIQNLAMLPDELADTVEDRDVQ